MLSMDFIKSNRADVERAIRDKGVDLDIDRLERLDDEAKKYQALQNALEALCNDITRRVKSFYSKNIIYKKDLYKIGNVDLNMRLSILRKFAAEFENDYSEYYARFLRTLSFEQKRELQYVLLKELNFLTQTASLSESAILQIDRLAIEEAKKSSKIIGEFSKTVANDSKRVRGRLRELELKLPGIPWDGAPVGPDESYNTVIRTEGAVPSFDFEPLDHVALIEKNDWADLSRIVQVSGSRTYCLKGRLAILEMKLMAYAMDKIAAAGFTAITVPAIAREQAFLNQGQFPGHVEETYALPNDDAYLAGTAEVALTSLHSGEIVENAKMPLLYAGYSPCFRREAGSAGKDVRGLLRVHQFLKVEQWVMCEADEAVSAEWHAKLLQLAESLLRDLEIPYQVIETSTGDMGLGKYRMNDIESWVPSLNKYRETHSCSTLHDWQARRANLRYRDADGKVRFAHTLNNTALASPRILVPLLENHQTADGRVRLPKALRDVMGGDEYL